MKLVGCALLLLGLVPSAFAAEIYREIWNPPEARDMPLHRTTAHKQVKHTYGKPRIVKARNHRVPIPTPTLAMKRHASPTRVAKEPPEPNLSDIPRQITPEGNILRVDSRNAAAKVTR